nr:hypothetical protein KUHPSE09_08750 [Staphylococcus epidermidis]
MSYMWFMRRYVYQNSMNCLMEVLGLALPYNGTALAVSDQRREMIRQAAFRLVENIKHDIKPRDIITQDAIDDAFALDMAMGGSTNTVLHTLAIANEAGIDYDLERINEIAKKHLTFLKLHLVLLILCMMFMKQVACQLS